VPPISATGAHMPVRPGECGDIATAKAPPMGPIPFTPRTKKVLELSLREALALGHHYIGTEHLLPGLLREGKGVAAQVLTRLSADHGQVRDGVPGLLADECEQADPQTRLATELADTAEQLAQVRRHKEATFDAGDLDLAAALRDQEKQLHAGKLRLEQQLTLGVGGQAVIAENQRLHRELDRLRDLLRQHGIEPDDGTARTA
jgi:ATP-dependent Clp protease ATP-binding subunit ClpA